MGKIHLSKRRIVTTLSVVAFVALLFSPIGHASTPVRSSPIAWSARANGPCPFDPARTFAPDPACTASWRFGPAVRLERDTRRLFLLRTSSRLLEIRFTVRFGARVPWIDSMAFNEHASPVCLASCPQRIELRSGNDVFALVRAQGVAARRGPLDPGVTYRGSWTYDVARARGALRLHVPGLKDIRVTA